MTDDLPGGGIASRLLHFIWMLDVSASMSGEKIGQLNFAMRESIDPMADAARDNPTASVLIRVLTFSSGARWHVDIPTPVDKFKWSDVKATGVTDTGRALKMVAEQLRMPPMTSRALPPVIGLITDGQPTDDFDGGLATLMKEPWGQRAVRIGIGVGKGTDTGSIARFIGNPEIPVLEAQNPKDLVNYIRWASTVVVKSASSPLSRTKDEQGQENPPIPPPPPSDNGASGGDVW